jgi:hypothetical protein
MMSVEVGPTTHKMTMRSLVGLSISRIPVKSMSIRQIESDAEDSDAEDSDAENTESSIKLKIIMPDGIELDGGELKPLDSGEFKPPGPGEFKPPGPGPDGESPYYTECIVKICIQEDRIPKNNIPKDSGFSYLHITRFCGDTIVYKSFHDLFKNAFIDLESSLPA